ICFGNQFLVLQRLRVNESLDSVTEQVGVFAIVEPEAHLITVGLQVLRADLVPCADYAALEERKCRLNRIGVNVPYGIVAFRVIDGCVLGVQFSEGLMVSGKVIRHDHVNIPAHVFFDVLCQCSALYIGSMEEPQSAMTLPDADNNLFRSSTTALAA